MQAARANRRTPTCRVRGVADGQPDVPLEPGDGVVIDPEGRVVARRRGASLRLDMARQLPGARLPGGWYWISLQAHGEDEALVESRVSVSMRSPHTPSESFLLPEPDGAGRIACLLMFPHDVHGLQLVPSAHRGVFRIEAMRLSRLGKPAALWKMLTADRWRGLGWALAAGLDWLGALPGSGLGASTVRLYRRYRERFVGVERGYPAWVHRYDTLSNMDIEVLSARAAELSVAGPLVSILLPVFNTPAPWLRRCIDSVLAQTYPTWELCISDDASTLSHVLPMLRAYARDEPRIRLVERPCNGHISEASNSALDIATGTFVALLDHDDELRPHALQSVVEALAASPAARFVYSDEDKIDVDGNRFDPYFKPAWDRELLLGQNYLCHLSVIDTNLVRQVGGFRKGYEGSQDHDLFLRCTACLADHEIVHVPQILYHWRAVPGSTALGRGEKDYAAQAGGRAVADHLLATEPGARVESLSHGHYRVLRPLPAPAPRVSIIVPTRDRLDLLRTCVESVLARTDYPDFELLVVDNQSREPATLAYLESLVRDQRARVIGYDHPFNYSAINNQAVASCRSDIVCLLNNDIEVIDGGWLHELASRAARPGIGAVGARLLYPDDTLQHAGVVLGVLGVANHAFAGFALDHPGHGGRARVAQRYSAVTGACLVVAKERYLSVGGMDESLAVAFNDIDLCLRLRRAGYCNEWTPFATLYHHESATRGSDTTPEKAARFQREVDRMEARWAIELADDPAYNPNLTLDATDFGLAFPPRGYGVDAAGLSIGRTSIAPREQSR